MTFKLAAAALTCAFAATAWRLQPVSVHHLAASQSQKAWTQPGRSSSIFQHPADWSRDVYPVPVHSHNDYWRDVPVLDALAHGVRSVESDVWLNPNDGELYVGHDPFSLSQERTFESLTLKPLRAAIDQANSANHVHSNSKEAQFFKSLQKAVVPNLGAPWSSNYPQGTWTGFFSAGVGSAAPLQLLIDIKTDGNETFPSVLKALQPLAEKGYLTVYDADADKIVPGPLLAIGTGNTPASFLAGIPSPRYIFLDCPLGKLKGKGVKEESAYDNKLCGIASASFNELVPGYNGVREATNEQRRNFSAAIDEAHNLDIKTRIWDTPNWPIYARDRVNRMLLELGSDWINADDLKAISTF